MAEATKDNSQATATRQPGQPWSLDDAASFLSVSKKHLQRLLNAGKLKTILIGKRRLVPDTEMRRLAESGTE